MRDFNNQILNAWESAKSDNGGEHVTSAMEESMQSLKFCYPVRSKDEMDEVVRLCLFYHRVAHDPQSILNEFRRVSKKLDVSLSLTERCGNQCCHCSTDATLVREKTNVPFENGFSLQCFSSHIASLK